jgi:hypothetical protein
MNIKADTYLNEGYRESLLARFDALWDEKEYSSREDFFLRNPRKKREEERVKIAKATFYPFVNGEKPVQLRTAEVILQSLKFEPEEIQMMLVTRIDAEMRDGDTTQNKSKVGRWLLEDSYEEEAYPEEEIRQSNPLCYHCLLAFLENMDAMSLGTVISSLRIDRYVSHNLPSLTQAHQIMTHVQTITGPGLEALVKVVLTNFPKAPIFGKFPQCASGTFKVASE